MTWELVAMVGVLVVVGLMAVLLLGAMISAAKDASTKRHIDLYKAGLLPPGWKE